MGQVDGKEAVLRTFLKPTWFDSFRQPEKAGLI